MPRTPHFTKENAAELGRIGGLKSAEVRKRKAALPPEDRAKEAIRDKVGNLVSELLDLALGEGDFSGKETVEEKEDGTKVVTVMQEATPELRFRAITVALSYGLGRPTAIKTPHAPHIPQEEETGLVFETGE